MQNKKVQGGQPQGVFRNALHRLEQNTKDTGEECVLRVQPVILNTETYDAVLSALRIGYRHIDTAQVYGNEADVGRAVADSGINRQDLFLTTKLWKSEWGYDRARASIQESLQAS
ncbi:hypothetical protein N2152v2_005095 [Parachlorella kessleri]